MQDLYDIDMNLVKINDAISYIAKCAIEPCYVKIHNMVIDVNKITMLNVVYEYIEEHRTHKVKAIVDGVEMTLYYGTKAMAFAVADEIEAHLPTKVNELKCLNTPA